jgi:acyl-coenzyme A synthetase/AMP-(fatty) acid ligase
VLANAKEGDEPAGSMIGTLVRFAEMQNPLSGAAMRRTAVGQRAWFAACGDAQRRIGHVEFAEALPMTATGKVLQRELRASKVTAS